MRIRVQIAARRPFSFHRYKALAYVASLVLAPSAVIAFTLALWNIAADMHWAGDFFISHGFFSHSQVWIATSALLAIVLRLLHRLTSEDSGALGRGDALGE